MSRLRAGLRRQVVARVVLSAIRSCNRAAFRVVHYSVQDNHVHLMVEAEHTASLSSGMRGLAVRVARRVNRLLRRAGRFWTVRHALVYVLQNHHKHSSLATSARVSPNACAEHSPIQTRFAQLASSESPESIERISSMLTEYGKTSQHPFGYREARRSASCFAAEGSAGT